MQIGDDLLAQEAAGGGQVLWALADNLGTNRDFVDNTGALPAPTYHLKYDSFGNVVSGDAAISRYLYTGQEYDSDAGLYYYNARWYDPKTGKFLSQDPLGFAAGDLNLSRYVNNGVVNATDPSGLVEEDVPNWARRPPASGPPPNAFLPPYDRLTPTEFAPPVVPSRPGWNIPQPPPGSHFQGIEPESDPPWSRSRVSTGPTITHNDRNRWPYPGQHQERLDKQEEFRRRQIAKLDRMLTGWHIVNSIGAVCAGAGGAIPPRQPLTRPAPAANVSRPPIIRTPPIYERRPNYPPPKLPSLPSNSPGPGWIWKGDPLQPVGKNGTWINMGTWEKLYPDLNHPYPVGPPWDWQAPDGTRWRIFPDGSIVPR